MTIRKSLEKNQIFLKDLKFKNENSFDKKEDTKKLQLCFGYTKEDINFFIEPILKLGIEPIGSMGTDTPISLLSDKPKLLLVILNNVLLKLQTRRLIPLERNWLCH